MTVAQEDATIELCRSKLREFYEDFAHCLDTDRLEDFPDFFTEQARYRIIPRENYDAGLEHAPIYCAGRAMIHDRVVAIREAALYQPRSLRHFISGPRVLETLDDGSYRTMANFLIVESLLEVEPQILMVGQYFDEIERSGPMLRIRDRTCVYDNYRIRTTLVIPV
ncbi:ring-hydroxylating dioxygenase subunit beta [Croceicoccus ponticola]|uniref:Ring-hydroxylating dioxygenase subunit beta n=1 Tax=Croceicoccus ponticola TaxID=2217664 RepID=A0A437H2G9_9SPHN|nr:aromatic-ring-hydroxylating dioxygenase subunit beta [Croceicoccus ponticola]RVQ69663.1 ring-hydroxylating dioxygenase subunit beta [Croceicoccus ponticola]